MYRVMGGNSKKCLAFLCTLNLHDSPRSEVHFYPKMNTYPCRHCRSSIQKQYPPLKNLKKALSKTWGFLKFVI